MNPEDDFVVASQGWLKALIVFGTVGFATLALFILAAGIKSNQPIAWITVVAVACGAGWLVAVGIGHMRFFAVALQVTENRITVASRGGRRSYPIDELNLRTRPIANAIELRHIRDGRLFVADMYTRNASRLVHLFEQHVAR